LRDIDDIVSIQTKRNTGSSKLECTRSLWNCRRTCCHDAKNSRFEPDPAAKFTAALSSCAKWHNIWKDT